MRIAVTGKTGQVVTSLIERAAGSHEIVTLGRPECDLADLATVAPAIMAARPDVVVNAGAFTAVDGAENARDAAFAINGWCTSSRYVTSEKSSRATIPKLDISIAPVR